jgi:hypothetical protein
MRLRELELAHQCLLHLLMRLLFLNNGHESEAFPQLNFNSVDILLQTSQPSNKTVTSEAL